MLDYGFFFYDHRQYCHINSKLLDVYSYYISVYVSVCVYILFAHCAMQRHYHDGSKLVFFEFLLFEHKKTYIYNGRRRHLRLSVNVYVFDWFVCV